MKNCTRFFRDGSMPGHRCRGGWRILRLIGALAAGTILGWPICAQAPPDLTSKSIEDLMNIEVTSASKKEQKLSRVAAAVFVITQEDIRRSGATNIPDLLRIVPGLDVAQINGSTWAIGARGFNEQLSNKLLVMVDERIVYTEAFGGVYWDTVDLPLGDIDRIEVIRGPGGSIWGAYAVNGVISIFTKRAPENREGLLEATGGNIIQGAGTAEYGDKIGKDTGYRVFAKYFNNGQTNDLTGQDGQDGWHMLRGGFRTDSTLTAKDTLTVEGNLYTEREGELAFFLPSLFAPGLITLPDEITSAGGFIQSSWKHQYSETSNSELQVSFTHYTRDDPLEAEERSTLYADYQYQFGWGKRQNIIFGVGDFYTNGQINGTLTVFFSPAKKSLDVANAFFQDEIAIVPDKLYVTVGAKLEHNDFTGFQFIPSIRAAWELSKRQMVWAAVSRAVRTPTPNDTDLQVNLGGAGQSNGLPAAVRFVGNPNFQDEQLIAYEAGYRTTLSSRMSLDLAVYYNDYDHLQSTEPSGSFVEATPAPPHVVETLTYGNLLYGETHGLEALANWKATERWQVSAGFAYEGIHLHTQPQSEDAGTVPFVQGNTPNRMGQLRSHVDLAKGWSWDASAYYVDPLRNQGFSGTSRIPGYTRLDTGLTWKARERFSASVVGQNLLQKQHVEFEDFFGSMQSGQMKRSGYVKLTWQF